MDVLDVPEVHSSRASNWVALFDDFTDRFVGEEREGEREKKRVCVLRCARTSAPVILRARDHTHYAHTLHTTHNRTHRVLSDRLVLLHFAFICFNDLATNVRMAQAQSAATLGLFSVAHQPPRPLRPGQFLALLIA